MLKISKKIYIIIIAALLVISTTVMTSAAEVQKYLKFPALNQIKANSENPTVVATVGKKSISSKDLAAQTEVERAKWESVGEKRDYIFYETQALGYLISNTLLDQEVQKRNLVVSDAEATKYLNDIVSQLQSYSATDPAKVDFMNAIQASGFFSIEDYISSPDVIKATVAVLSRGKLKESIYNSVEPPTDIEVAEYAKKNNINLTSTVEKQNTRNRILQQKQNAAWEGLKTSLISDKSKYNVLVSLDITGYDQRSKELAKRPFREVQGKMTDIRINK